jgi:hypothetical protein
VALLAWAVFWPCTEPRLPTDSSSAARENAAVTDPPEQSIDQQQFAALSSKRLRAPLGKADSQATEDMDAVPMDMPDPLLNLTLRGTIVEKGHSVAIFSTAESPLELRGIGEVVGEEGDEAEVVEIQRDLVVLRYQGELVKLPFPESEGP